MLVLECPWCGTRDQSEFHCHGEAHIERPVDTENLTEKEWGEYVFFRKNTKGIHYERWTHDHGCKRWFNAVRNTATDEFLAFYKPGDKPPVVEGEQ